MFERGTWIGYKVEPGIGFVDFSNTHITTVCFVKNGKVVRTQNVMNSNIYKLGSELNSEDLFELINMALSMNDKQWFITLATRLKRQSEREMVE